jgi:hypothetical protein
MFFREVEIFFEKCFIGWIACFFVVSQGDFSNELLCMALLTGTIAGIACAGSSFLEFFTFGKNVWLEAWVTGILVMMADMIVHPSNIGNLFWIESALTGLCAAIIFIVHYRIKTKL